MTRRKVVNPRFAKSKEYKNVISTIDRIGRCPFCPDNFRYHKKPILKRSNGWLITQNSWPYKNAKYHFLIISLQHHERLAELKTRDLKTIWSLSTWAIKRYKITGGAITMRFGNSNRTGATVSHLHAHLIYPGMNKKGYAKTVNFPIG